MGIIKAATNAVSGSLAGQWLDYIVSDHMDNEILMTRGVRVIKSKRGYETSPIQTIANNSKIKIAPNQFMILCNNGQIVDYCATEGNYEVQLSSAPSMFNGDLSEAVSETFERIKYGGQPTVMQEVYFINLQEIKGLKFGTRNPLQYFDEFYNVELFIRCHGTYSVKITDPLKFFEEMVPQNADHVSTQALSDQCLEEFLMALQGAVSNMSQDGVRISNLGAKNLEIVSYLNQQLDTLWKEQRGIELVSVGIGNISYDEESRELINIRSRKIMEQQEQPVPERTSEPEIRSEKVNLKKNTVWACECGSQNYGDFCAVCGRKRPAKNWVCACGLQNTGNFCVNCGRKRPS